MYMFVRMTIHIIVVWVFVMYISVRLIIHSLIGFVMYMFVRMTIHFFWMDFCDVHVCTNDYTFLLYISVRMTTISFWMDFPRVHFCTNDYHFFLNGLLSCIFLYEWLQFIFERILVIYISVQMTTISFWLDCCHAHFCTDDYHLFFLMDSRNLHLLYEWLCWIILDHQ